MRYRVYTIDELKKNGAEINESTLHFQGKLFKIGPRIRKNFSDAVEEYCSFCLTKKLAFLVVEDEVYLTVWKQDQVLNPSLGDLENSKHTLMNQLETNLELRNEELVAYQSDDTLSPEFLDQCRQSLLLTVGPIADIIFDEALSNSRVLNREQFIEELAKHIPDKNLVDIFFRNCQL
ncbi:hypothetical protein [Acaryochloris sp. IP29b_bin.137]|uniref:hypothetical protein n=1 Tax=Acaryochloris sp. IP29b_bin.137 TaxID=2969217 RepID=UPI00263697BC|nr:hypothetical protein [Acaryochloris sp. IP29b_bin.137]